MSDKFVAGVDFGTDSVRVVLLEANTGITFAEATACYPRWNKNLYCDAEKSQYRQHPLDYLECFEEIFTQVIHKAGKDVGQNVLSLAIDTTGSTPCPVNRNGIPLALFDEFKENPNAMFHLWKDHTAVDEAKKINEVFSKGEVDYTYYQGIYSSEWYWSKIMHTTQSDPLIRKNAWFWVEHVDWIAGLLTDNILPETMFHCSCAAGHKALWHSAFNGLPSKECLKELDVYLCDIYDRYTKAPVPAGTCIGTISEEWAKRLKLNKNVKIGIGSFDAHAGGVGAGVAPKTLVKVIGTSTVDMLVESPENLKGKDLRVYCGQAEDSIVPGFVGLEMSQPAFGDAYSWFRELILWPFKNIDIPNEIMDNKSFLKLEDWIYSNIFSELEKESKKYLADDSVALDWFNGRRYPQLNESVRSAICGLGLETDAPSVYCAIVKGTVFGSKRIYNSLVENGLEIHRLIAVGGITKKSELIMQMMSDALNIPIMVCEEEQVCARGSAIFAAVAAGIFDTVIEAQNIYCEKYKANYYPDIERNKMYEKMYRKYLILGRTVEFEI